MTSFDVIFYSISVEASKREILGTFMKRELKQVDFFEENTPIYQRYLPKITEVYQGVFQWDIPHSIKRLSYLVHSDYRYYGKFPSVVAGQILELVKQPSPEHYVLDNFCGSGTTLVEAKLRGIPSVGIDISWLSSLASNVKVRHVNTKEILKKTGELSLWFHQNYLNYTAPQDNFCEKWFDEDAARDLNAIKDFIKKLDQGSLRDFMLVAFLAIIRRVSMAHDAEVRPHINKDKKQRNVIEAFVKKIEDMCVDHEDFQRISSKETTASCSVSNNLSLGQQFNDKKCYLVVSHPPYLNSFNYSPVFNLEFYWGKEFEHEFSEGNDGLHKTEMKAHPATETITDKYFEHLRKCYSETYRIQDEGAYLAVVIGDCTRKGKLVPVIDKTIEIIENIGYQICKLNYRTTHYGLGKYAYKARADYHGGAAEKRDAIILFKK